MDYELLYIDINSCNTNEKNNNFKILKKSCSEDNMIIPILKDCYELSPVDEVLKKILEHIAFLSEEIKMLKEDIKNLKELNKE
jgi:hypothetical protein